MECLHRFCRECIDKSMRLGYVFKRLPSPFLFKWNIQVKFAYIYFVWRCLKILESLNLWPDMSISYLDMQSAQLEFWLLVTGSHCRNNECPACRTHCASRRSLRDDPNYDALIAAIYPDIDKYEEEVWCWFTTILDCKFYFLSYILNDCADCWLSPLGTGFSWRGEGSQ